MNKYIFSPLIFLFSLNSFSQIKFEKGYFITNKNGTVQALIRNVNYKNTPEQFQYRLTENSTTKVGDINEIKEFAVYDGFKYQRQTVKIDQSGIDNKSVSTSQMPEFIEKEVYLRVLIEGDASLYSYKNGDLKRYFYSSGKSGIEPLIFSTFKTPENKIAKNRRYQQQLYNTFNCGNISIANIENIEYENGDLINYFEKYNKCNNVPFKVYRNKALESEYNLSIKVGTALPDFEEKLSFGIEAEYVLPVFYNKLSIIFEPTYYLHKAEREISFYNAIPPPSNPTGPYTFREDFLIEFTALEIPLGLRYSLFLNHDSKLFIEVAGAYDLFLDTEIFSPQGKITDFNLESGLNSIIGGIGYNYDSKYAISFKVYSTKLNLNEQDWIIDRYTYYSLNLGYTIF